MSATNWRWMIEVKNQENGIRDMSFDAYGFVAFSIKVWVNQVEGS